MRGHPQAQPLYYGLKDARNSARAAERSVAADEPIGVVSFWNDVNTSALLILSEHSKDIEVLCWLCEAQLRLRGFGGLRDSFAVLSALIDQYWPELYSVADDTVEDRVAPLTGLNGQGGEGVLIQALRLTSLVPDTSYGRFGLWDYQRAQRTGETALRDALYQAVAEKGKAAMSAELANVESCLEHFNALTQKLDELCGADAPPASNIRQVLQEAAAAIRDMAHIEETTAEDSAVSANEAAIESAEAESVVVPVVSGAIRSREDAFETLLNVARFFRRTEPHSPTAQALETLVRRGRMDFQELLSELLPDEATRASVLTAAGIQPKIDKNGG